MYVIHDWLFLFHVNCAMDPPVRPSSLAIKYVWMATPSLFPFFKVFFSSFPKDLVEVVDIALPSPSLCIYHILAFYSQRWANRCHLLTTSIPSFDKSLTHPTLPSLLFGQTTAVCLLQASMGRGRGFRLQYFYSFKRFVNMSSHPPFHFKSLIGPNPLPSQL